MSDPTENPAAGTARTQARFAETHWSIVLSARRGGDSTRGADALARLWACQEISVAFYAAMV